MGERAEFVVVSRESSLASLVDKYMLERIGQLYGYPDVNFWTRDKMWFKSDRIVEVLMIDDKMVGNLIYKTDLSNEYESYGITNSLEMKSLYLFDAETNSGKGYATILFNRILQISKQYKALSIHTTVSEEVPESLAFFIKKGFQIKGELPIQFKPNLKQYLIQYLI